MQENETGVYFRIIIMTDFYSSLAPEYDRMTRFSDRLGSETTLLRNWINPDQVRSALDVACGTGLHTILLAKMGMTVTGVDLSVEMLAKAKSNAEMFKTPVNFLEGDMRYLKSMFKPSFDLIVCLGNSLPHLLVSKDLAATFNGFKKLLNPGGMLLLQQLNYDRVMSCQERIVGVNRKEGKEFVRFYDFKGKFLDFNILTITEDKGQIRHSLSTTKLYPYRKDEIVTVLEKQGFGNINIAGNLNKAPFLEGESPNLVIQAFKR